MHRTLQNINNNQHQQQQQKNSYNNNNSMFFGVRLKENPFYYHTFSNIYKRKMVERLNETIIKQNYQQQPKKIKKKLTEQN